MLKGVVRMLVYDRYLITPSKTEFGVYDLEELSLFSFGGNVPASFLNILIGRSAQYEFEKMVKFC